ncbi:MAG: hypothetical protein ACOC6H_00240 [Thermoproteota archaeon]
MPQDSPSKDEAFEALDFIINVLREHERDLDRLISDLGTITERLGNTEDLCREVENVEGKLATLQEEVTNLITYVSNSPRPQLEEIKEGKSNVQRIRGPPTILSCKRWEDFCNLALRSKILSFLIQEEGNKLQVDGLKDNRIITYSGEPPEQDVLLRTWLSRELDIPEKKILEGTLAIG